MHIEDEGTGEQEQETEPAHEAPAKPVQQPSSFPAAKPAAKPAPAKKPDTLETLRSDFEAFKKSVKKHVANV
jgi:hypothetical protein